MGELKPHFGVLLFPEYRALKVIADEVDHLLIRTVSKWRVNEIKEKKSTEQDNDDI